MDTTKIIEKQFVTYEIAKLLKEIGFDEPCLAYYSHDSRYNHNNEIKLFMYGQPKEYEIFTSETFDDLEDGEYNAPLWQQVIDWLRINHKLEITIFNCGDKYPTVEKDYDAYYYIIGDENGFIVDTYEEAREQGILNTLKKIK